MKLSEIKDGIYIRCWECPDCGCDKDKVVRVTVCNAPCDYAKKYNCQHTKECMKAYHEGNNLRFAEFYPEGCPRPCIVEEGRHGWNWAHGVTGRKMEVVEVDDD